MAPQDWLDRMEDRLRLLSIKRKTVADKLANIDEQIIKLEDLIDRQKGKSWWSKVIKRW